MITQIFKVLYAPRRLESGTKWKKTLKAEQNLADTQSGQIQITFAPL